ncbi:MAG: adenylate cyclase, partial [Okeania sp. SIO1H6]|nr:adenylate cyclase [Okeania sp. SIO1H6]
MFNRPKFRASICVKLTEQGEVFLLSERYFTLLDDPLLQLISPLIDGERTVDEIITILEGKVASTQIYYVLMWMKQQGYIEESDNFPLPASAVFSDALCEAYKLDVKNAQNNLNQTKVAVKSIGSTSASELISILESLEIEVAEDGDIEVILTDDYLCTDIGVIKQQALHHSRPW